MFHQLSSIYNMEKKLFVLVILLIDVFSLDYTFKTSESHLLRNGFMAITSISRDHSGEFLAFFIDNQVRRYQPNLSTYLNWTVPYPVYYSSAQATNIPDVTLANGTVYNITGKLTTTLSKVNRVLETYSYPNFARLSHYEATQKLLSFRSVDVRLPSGSEFPLSVIIGEASIMTYYLNQSTALFTYDIDYNTGVTCAAAVLKTQAQNISLNQISLTYIFVLSLSNNDLIEVKVVANISFNASAQAYDLVGSAQIWNNYPPLWYPASAIIITNNVIFLQNVYGITAYDGASSTAIYFDASIPTGTLLSVIFKDNRWFMLQDSIFLELKWVNTIGNPSNGFYQLATMASFSSKKYAFVSGALLDLIYVPGEAKVYQLGYCHGNTQYNGSTCVGYTCSDSKCSSCWILPSVCGICLSGYPRTDYFYCVVLPPLNSTNISGVANSSIVNESIYLFTELISSSKQAVRKAVSLPSGRRLAYPLFYFFGNFDDLYLYSYHGFYYGKVAEYIFKEIEDIESTQWSLLTEFHYMDEMTSENSRLWRAISSRERYLRFYNGKSENLLTNCYFYFIFSLPVSVIIFLIMRALFYGLSSYSVSKFIRSFDLWGFLFVLLFDGNIQQFSFFSASNMQNTIFLHHFQKYITVFLVLFVFVLVVLSFGGYFMGLFVYQKLNKNLTDNNKNDLRGNVFLLLQICVRNFVLGSSHSFVRFLSKEAAVGTLIGIEVSFVALFANEATNKVFKSIFKIWIYVLLSLTRILFLFTFLFDHKSDYSQALQKIQETTIMLNILIYLISVLMLVFELASNLIRNLFIAKSQSRNRHLVQAIIKDQITRVKTSQIQSKLEQNSFKENRECLSFANFDQIN